MKNVQTIIKNDRYLYDFHDVYQYVKKELRVKCKFRRKPSNEAVLICMFYIQGVYLTVFDSPCFIGSLFFSYGEGESLDVLAADDETTLEKKRKWHAINGRLHVEIEDRDASCIHEIIEHIYRHGLTTVRNELYDISKKYIDFNNFNNRRFQVNFYEINLEWLKKEFRLHDFGFAVK